MARPKEEHPTPGELEVLKILWEQGPATVREVMEVLNERKERAYTSVMSLLNVMVDKGLLRREPHGRAFLYHAKAKRRPTLGRMVGDLLGRAFEGSTTALIAHLLEESHPTADELEKIRETVEGYREQNAKPPKGRS